MNTVAIRLEEKRLENVKNIADYNMVHERHRIFPALFENRQHRTILDMSAGMGVVAQRIRDQYPCSLICNDICPKCLQSLNDLGLQTISFDLDNAAVPFPFPAKSFDAIISLSTIEHLIHLEHFLEETRRILDDNGFLYISSPNYSSLSYMLPFVLKGQTFHDPFSQADQYEFYAHYRYFTYKTLLQYVRAFGFSPVASYIGKPHGSSYYQRLKRQSKWKSLCFKVVLSSLCHLLPPRWSSEPVLCFRKGSGGAPSPKKIVL